jgi:hypothetical protein
MLRRDGKKEGELASQSEVWTNVDVSTVFKKLNMVDYDGDKGNNKNQC